MPVRNPRPLLIGAALLLALGSTSPTPAAPPGPRGKPERPGSAAASKLDLAALQKQLESGDETRTLAALDTLQNSGDPAGAALVEALLARGASMTVLGRALATLESLAQPSSGAALAPYARHRAPGVRRAALRALIATKSPIAGDVLRRALRGSDATQRAMAARGLGDLNVRAAVPELFDVLPKDVPEAARALGQLCVADQCARLAALLGKLRFEVMESALVPLLLRPAADVPDELKLQVIERLRRMATAPANQILQTTLAQLGPDASPRVERGIERALKGFSATGQEK
jgi:HEAT repeat protein